MNGMEAFLSWKQSVLFSSSVFCPLTLIWQAIFCLSFSDLNMLAESEGSDHLDFQEHSKGKLHCF